MKRILMSILLAGLFAAVSAGQTVQVKVRAALYDRDLNLKPVPHLVVKLAPTTAGIQPLTIKTSLDGLAEASDTRISSPGSALFNSSGNAVGITQFSSDKFRIAPIAIASATLVEARQKLTSSAPPPLRLLPTIPADEFPSDKLRAPGRGHWEKEVYSFKAGDFYVELVTPIAQYEADTENYEVEMKDYNKHSKNRTAPSEPEYKYEVALRIAAIPQTKMPFWENMANSSLSNGRAPTVIRYKTGFAKMRLLCGEKEVDPIWPGRVKEGAQDRGWNVVLADESSGGRYLYAHDAISPKCGKVTLQLFSTKNADHPVEKILDAQQVERIWQDFEPYRQLQTQHEVVAPQQ